ncbi:unnamed protein product, partial [Sphenostylis stenocarpa]
MAVPNGQIQMGRPSRVRPPSHSSVGCPKGKFSIETVVPTQTAVPNLLAPPIYDKRGSLP